MSGADDTATPVRYEYRLRWQRLGRKVTGQIMQRENHAVAKGERLLELDELKLTEDLSPYYSMPDLVMLRLERREVGLWEPAPHTFDVPEPDPESASRAREDAGVSAGDFPW